MTVFSEIRTNEIGWVIADVDGQKACFPPETGNSFYDEMIAQGLTVPDYVDPRTPQQIYDEEVLAQLDAQVLKGAARMVEDFYDALVDQLPQSMKDKHGPLMAERKAKRAARP